MSLLRLPLPAVTLMLALGLAAGCSASSPSAEEQAPAVTTAEPDTTSSTSAAAPEAAAPETAASATAEVASSAQAPAAVFAEDGVAIRGADPVAYFTQGEYVPGSADYTYDWGEATWQFASAENRDLFASNPNEYAPQYGGFCAWAVSEGYTAPVDPTAWEIVDGKLYLNFDQRIQRRWQRDIPGHIVRANENWPSVLNN